MKVSSVTGVIKSSDKWALNARYLIDD